MIRPDTAALWLAWALGLGAALGIVYGFLRPLRPALTGPADLIFVICAFSAWVYLNFGICEGDLRLPLQAAMLGAALVTDRSLGRLLRPVFFGFWRPIRLFLALPGKFYQKIYKKIRLFLKKLFASWKKWITITEYKTKPKGGRPRGRDRTQDQTEIPSHK